MCFAGKRPAAHKPHETAGLKWPPEIGPRAYAIVNTVRPNARETPVRPIPTSGKVAASTALPHPPNTSQSVPKNSAISLETMLELHGVGEGPASRWIDANQVYYLVV